MYAAAVSVHIPLRTAYLCPDCECISNSSRRCPACSNEVLLGLAAVLNREIAESAAREEIVYRPALVA